jgi:hypothetical protein
MALSELFARRQPGGVLALQNIEKQPGNIYFVNSATGTDSTSNGTGPDAPFKTINYAIAQCTASKGDIIYVMPGHSESISGVGAIAASIIGVQIIGLGTGTLRPLITLHTTATTIAVSAASVTFKNLRITGDVTGVVTIFNITAANCTIDGVDFIETASCAALQFILTTSAAVDLRVQNCSWIQTVTAAGALQQWIVLTGADRAKILNNYASLKGYATSNPANGVVVGVTTASANVEIGNNTFISSNSTGTIAISLLAATTGFVYNNRVASAKSAIAGQVACASCFASSNYSGHVANTSGLLDPVVDS